MFFGGHLEEIDDLKTFKRDAPVEMSPENMEVLEQMVSGLERKIRDENSIALILVTSPKLRSVQTCDLIASKLKEKLGASFKIRVSINSDLDSPDQGDFSLPENYKAGDFFEGLKFASKHYLDESLKSDNNLKYRFGDPVLQGDGTYKYPELAKYFTEYGETYGEALSRVLKSVVKASEKIDKFNRNVDVSIISHGFVFHILRGLSILAQEMKGANPKIKTGDLAGMLWDVYQKYPISLKTTPFANIDISSLGDTDMIEIIKTEIIFLDS